MVDAGEDAADGPPDAAPAVPHRELTARMRSVVGDGAVLFGLAGLAVTQPLLDLFGNNPTFFVAGNYTGSQIVVFALAIALVPAFAVLLVTALPALLGRRAARIGHAVGVAFFGALLGLQILDAVGVSGAVIALLAAAAFGAAVAAAEVRWAPARSLLQYLAIANLAFVALFLFASPASALLGPDASVDLAGVRVPAISGPVTVVVLDEFPLQAMLRPDGTINDTRYPNLAALAGESTWFRNAASENLSTYLSVPSILTGRLADEDALPVHRDHPRNLFSLFGDRYPINRYEVVTDLCPSTACDPPPAQPVSQALDDAFLVFQHRVLPESMRADLPAIDQDWGSFGGDAEPEPEPDPVTQATDQSGEPDPLARLDEVPEDDRGRAGQLRALRRQAELITAEPSINLIHVLHPHHPYYATPWGVESAHDWTPESIPGPNQPGHERAFAELYGQQAMQLGALDQVLGEVVAHLEAVGAWDEGTFVLVSDHGVDVTPPGFGRVFDEVSQDELLRIPLFVKVPGQTEGEIRDEPASTIDVLPSLIGLLGIETDWEMDGHSLYDGSEPTAERRLTSSLDTFFATLERQHPERGTGNDWWSIVAIGDQGDLVSSSVSDHTVGAPSRLTWRLDGAETLADPASAGNRIPIGLRGVVTSPADTDDEPPDLVVALDGILSGTVGGYRRDDAGWAFTGLLGPTVEGGADDVTAFEVERTPDGVVLHPVAPG